MPSKLGEIYTLAAARAKRLKGIHKTPIAFSVRPDEGAASFYRASTLLQSPDCAQVLSPRLELPYTDT